MEKGGLGRWGVESGKDLVGFEVMSAEDGLVSLRRLGENRLRFS